MQENEYLTNVCFCAEAIHALLNLQLLPHHINEDF